MQWRPGSSPLSPALSPFCLLTLVHFASLHPALEFPRWPKKSAVLHFHFARALISLLSAAVQRTALADFIHRFINLSSAGVSPLQSPPPHPPTPHPSSPLTVSLSACFLIFACHFFPLPPSIDPLCAKRERGWKSEINTWTGEPAGISIEMEVWSHSPGFDEPLSSLRHRTVNITECLDVE